MKINNLCLSLVLASITIACIDNNNKDNNTGAKNQDSDYREEAPTYNKTEDEVTKSMDTVAAEKRIPKDSVERKSKGNAAIK
jgi:hypothetical protein